MPDHLFRYALCNEESALHIEVQHRVIISFCNVRHGFRPVGARIVDEYVECRLLGEERGDRRDIADIEDHPPMASPRQCRGGRLHFFSCPREQRHFSSRAGKRRSGRKADSATRARDHS